ncbi:S1 RNA-binding domain-containing protein [Sulfoacidibacillus thermotolerans]|uniref:S1 motif domain-containing protein n=1 Tax=Sulfoacidibacillus thermotolerans TaxID=1765684 RepID=A0A2U3DBB4_SULT2|nr:S1 RNA-binding domain-containing protein [Sulfoacidibacillus thermotolerans]PWI58555.1 hypothetical protein BM613_03305 [Sulfoacidibacillus thermotolerans]
MYKGKFKHGETVEGIVKQIDEQGIWIDLQGITGWIPLAEIAFFEIEHPSEEIEPHAVLRVKVVGESEQGHLICSIREVEESKNV